MVDVNYCSVCVQNMKSSLKSIMKSFVELVIGLDYSLHPNSHESISPKSELISGLVKAAYHIIFATFPAPSGQANSGRTVTSVSPWSKLGLSKR